MDAFYKEFEIKKEKKEEILERWRTLGFVKGLEEGSVNEWRVAKSMELMAQYLLTHPEECNTSFDVCIFPIIRRCFTKNRRKVTRIIKPEEIISWLKENTVENFLQFAHIHTKKKEYKFQNEFFNYLWNLYKKILKLDNMSIMDAYKELLTQNNIAFVCTVFHCDCKKA